MTEDQRVAAASVVVGALLCVVGASLVALPLGLVCGGVLLAGFGFVTLRGSRP